MAGPTLRVLVADTQPVYRLGLRRALEEASGFEVVAEASNVPDAIQAASACVPDIFFLDCALPPSSGVDALREMARSGEGLPRSILVVPAFDGDHLLDHVRLGLRGVLDRSAPLVFFVKAARCVASGEYWIGREAAGDLMRLVRRDPLPEEGAHAADMAQRLTPREREIAAEVAAGHSNREIATRFSLCEDTVKHHLSSIFSKLGVSNRLELAVHLMQGRRVEKTPLAGG